MAKVSGFEVVRLPPYHCELNPIEMAWSQVKHHIKTYNTRFTLSAVTAVKELTYEGFEHVGEEVWKRYIKHSHGVEEKVHVLDFEDGINSTIG